MLGCPIITQEPLDRFASKFDDVTQQFEIKWVDFYRKKTAGKAEFPS